MANSNPVDIILDMVVGSVTDQCNDKTVKTSNDSPKDLIPMNKSKTDDFFKTDCLKPSLSSFNIKRSFGKIFRNFQKKKCCKKHETVDIAPFSATGSIESTINFYNTLKKGFPKFKYYFSETKIAKELFGYDIDFNEFKNNNNNRSNAKMDNNFNNNSVNMDNNGNNSNINMDNNGNVNNFNKEGLQLFFNHVIQTTGEFSEEEILELEMRILKIVKCIKGKRDLKQHLRRYAAAMSFKDPVFFNDPRYNI